MENAEPLSAVDDDKVGLVDVRDDELEAFKLEASEALEEDFALTEEDRVDINEDLDNNLTEEFDELDVFEVEIDKILDKIVVLLRLDEVFDEIDEGLVDDDDDETFNEDEETDRWDVEVALLDVLVEWAENVKAAGTLVDGETLVIAGNVS